MGAGHLLEKMTHSDGYVILLHAWNKKREQIIRDGKRARSEEGKIQNWARLDGFDDAVLTVENLIKADEKKDVAEIPQED